MRGRGEEAAVEIGNTFVTSAGLGRIGIHRFKEAADEIVGIGGRGAIVEQLRGEIFREQINVLGEKRDEHLQDEALRGGLIDTAIDDVIETEREFVGSFAGDIDAVVLEDRLLIREKGERSPALRKVFGGELIFGRVEVGVEIVNPKLVEVAEDDIARAVRHGARPVIEGLAIMFLEIFAALFHFDEHDWFPDVISEGSAAAILVGFADAKFSTAANVKGTGKTEGLKEPVEKDLRLPLFVAGDVFLIPVYKGRKLFGVRHGEVLREQRT